VLELARRFAKNPKWEGRTLVFMTFSGEEKGLLGSKHYCNKNPLFSLADTAAMVNLDMVGRMQKDKDSGKGKLIVEGTGTSKSFDELIEKFNKKYDFKLSKKKDVGGYSDQDSFYRKKIPVVFMWTGIHVDYHLPTDTWDKINYKDMARVVDMAEEVVAHLATVEKRPEYVYVPPPPIITPGQVKLGISIDYASEKKGLLIEGVSPNCPAAKGGL
jgi:Zn-dependent M28 family amino/carboxypeptidase